MKKFRYIFLAILTFLTFETVSKALPSGCDKKTFEDFNSKTRKQSDLTGLSLMCNYDRYKKDNNYYAGSHVEIWQNTSDPAHPIFYIFDVTINGNTSSTGSYVLKYCSRDYGGGNLEVHTPVYTTESGNTYEQGFSYVDSGVVTDVVEEGLYWDDHKADLHNTLVTNDGTYGVCPYYFGMHVDTETGYVAPVYSLNTDYEIAEGSSANVYFGKCTETDVTHKAVAQDILTDDKKEMTTSTTSKVTEDVKQKLIDSNTTYEDTLRNYESNLCKTDGVLKVFRGLRIIITIVKILIPLIIIIVGAVNFGKAVLDDNSDALNKNVKLLMKQIIIGVLVFFIPTIVTIFIGFIDDKFFDDSSISNCITCFNGSKDECDENIAFYEVYRYKLVDPDDLTEAEAKVVKEWYNTHDPEKTLMMDELVEKQKHSN